MGVKFHSEVIFLYRFSPWIGVCFHTSSYRFPLPSFSLPFCLSLPLVSSDVSAMTVYDAHCWLQMISIFFWWAIGFALLGLLCEERDVLLDSAPVNVTWATGVISFFPGVLVPVSSASPYAHVGAHTRFLLLFPIHCASKYLESSLAIFLWFYFPRLPTMVKMSS